MAVEYPNQDYYSSCKVRFIVRVEEFNGPISALIEKKLAHLRRAGNAAAAAAAAVTGGAAAAALAVSVGTPQQQVESGDKLTAEIAGVIPRSARLDRNGVREADTLSLEFKYSDLPFDPRTLRAIAAECFMGVVTPEDFQAGLAGTDRVRTQGGNEIREPLHVVPDTFQGPNGEQRSNLRFQGWVDRWEVTLSEEEPVLRVECSDNSRQLIDQPAPPQLTIDPRKPIDEAVADYLREFPQFLGFDVVFLPDEGKRPVIDEVLGKTSRRKGKGPPPGGGQGADVSVWDYLTDVIGMLGHLIRFEGTSIIIQQPRSMLKGGFPARPDDPFVLNGPRKLRTSGNLLERRLMLYGRNVSEASISREFTRHAPKNIEVRSYIPETKRTLMARFPTKADRQKRVNPGDKGEQVFVVRQLPVGIIDKKTLRAIAQQVYELEQRNEVETWFVTKNLASYGGGAEDPDLLDLMPGDPIDVEIQREEEILQGQTVNNLEDVLAVFDRGVALMKSIGFDEEFAKTYVLAFVDAGLVTTFRTRKVGFAWSEDDGIEVEVDAANYAVLDRSEVGLPEDEEPASPTAATTRVRV